MRWGVGAFCVGSRFAERFFADVFFLAGAGFAAEFADELCCCGYVRGAGRASVRDGYTQTRAVTRERELWNGRICLIDARSSDSGCSSGLAHVLIMPALVGDSRREDQMMRMKQPISERESGGPSDPPRTSNPPQSMQDTTISRGRYCAGTAPARKSVRTRSLSVRRATR